MSTGKWREPGVPHKGWVCHGVEKIDDGFMTCEMCEVMHIRYVHNMKHPEYPEVLLCGCVCAGNMSQDMVGAKRLESAFKRQEQRKAKQEQRKADLVVRRWKISAKGNPYINEKGWNLVVFPKDWGWSGLVKSRVSNETYFLQSKYSDPETAKLKVVELMEVKLKEGRI